MTTLKCFPSRDPPFYTFYRITSSLPLQEKHSPGDLFFFKTFIELSCFYLFLHLYFQRWFVPPNYWAFRRWGSVPYLRLPGGLAWASWRLLSQLLIIFLLSSFPNFFPLFSPLLFSLSQWVNVIYLCFRLLMPLDSFQWAFRKKSTWAQSAMSNQKPYCWISKVMSGSIQNHNSIGKMHLCPCLEKGTVPEV